MPAWLPIADFVAKIVIAVLTGILGLLAYFIARRQAYTSRNKLKLDLFDRRYAVYLSLNAWINDLQGRVVPDEEYTVHIRKMEQAQFLFAKDLNDWLRELRKKGRAMNNARRVSGEARQEDADSLRHAEFLAASKTYSQLTMEFDEELDRSGEMFSPYLDFSKNL